MSLLDDPGGPAIVLLAAPAGYGKTVLLRQWADRPRERPERVAWLPAEAAWAAPAAFLRHLARALGCGEKAETSIDALITGLREKKHRATLIIDDGQCLNSETCGLLRRVIAHRPSWLRVILAARAAPNLGLARLRASGELLEMSAHDLGFTTEELDSLFAATGLVSDPIIRSRFIRTADGWPAALVLAAPLLTDKGVTPANLVRRLCRRSCALGQYIDEEILEPLPADARRFLLETSALRHFAASLGEYVMGPQAYKQIRWLEENGLCVEMDTADGPIYRYNELLAAYAEAILTREAPARLREVHRAAAAWYKQHDQSMAAIPHAFASGDVDVAAGLLAEASDRHGRVGRWRAFTGWTSRLTPEMLDQHPNIRLEAACAHAVLFEFDVARTHMDAARRRFAELDDRAKDDLLTAEALVAAFGDRADAALDAGARGLRHCSGKDAYSLGTLRLAMALGLIARGELDKARQSLLEARADHHRADSPFGVAVALSLSGLTYAIEGDMATAIAAWREGEALIRPLSTAPAIEAIATGYMAEALYEWNAIDEAAAYVGRCFDSSAEIALPGMFRSLYLTRARIAVLRGDTAGAERLLDEAELVGLRRDWPQLVNAAGWVRVQFALRGGRVAEAHHRRAQMSDAGDPARSSHPEWEADVLGCLRFEAAFQPSRSTISKLRAATAKALAQNRTWRVVRLLIIEAMTRERLNDRAGALRTLRRAAELGAPGRLARSFVDEGATVVTLMQLLRDEESRVRPTELVGFMEHVLAVAGETAPQQAVRQAPIEALSERELEIVEMMAAGLSNRELGQRLFVTENTIKWHLQHVYAKLGVRNRTRAVAVAREQQLIT